MAGVREGTLFNVSQLSDGLRGASRDGKGRRLNLWLEEYRSIRGQCRATANRVIGRDSSPANTQWWRTEVA
jgi:hypothetical protein